MKKIVEIKKHELYILLDMDIEIKNKDPFLDMRDYPHNISDYDIYWARSEDDVEFANKIGKKITHSFGTELKGTINKPISEIVDLISGFNIIKEEYPESEFDDEFDERYRDGYKKGFVKGFQLNSDKMFTLEQAHLIWKAGQEYWRTSGKSITFEELIERKNDILKVKTEWVVEFNEMGKLILL